MKPLGEHFPPYPEPCSDVAWAMTDAFPSALSQLGVAVPVGHVENLDAGPRAAFVDNIARVAVGNLNPLSSSGFAKIPPATLYSKSRHNPPSQSREKAQAPSLAVVDLGVVFAVMAVVDLGVFFADSTCLSLDADAVAAVIEVADVADAAVDKVADVPFVADVLLAGTVDCADDLAALDIVSTVVLVTPISASENLTLPRRFHESLIFVLPVRHH